MQRTRRDVLMGAVAAGLLSGCTDRIRNLSGRGIELEEQPDGTTSDGLAVDGPSKWFDDPEFTSLPVHDRVMYGRETTAERRSEDGGVVAELENTAEVWSSPVDDLFYAGNQATGWFDEHGGFDLSTQNEQVFTQHGDGVPVRLRRHRVQQDKELFLDTGARHGVGHGYHPIVEALDGEGDRIELDIITVHYEDVTAETRESVLGEAAFAATYPEMTNPGLTPVEEFEELTGGKGGARFDIDSIDLRSEWEIPASGSVTIRSDGLIEDLELNVDFQLEDLSASAREEQETGFMVDTTIDMDWEPGSTSESVTPAGLPWYDRLFDPHEFICEVYDDSVELTNIGDDPVSGPLNLTVAIDDETTDSDTSHVIPELSNLMLDQAVTGDAFLEGPIVLGPGETVHVTLTEEGQPVVHVDEEPEDTAPTAFEGPDGPLTEPPEFNSNKSVMMVTRPPIAVLLQEVHDAGADATAYYEEHESLWGDTANQLESRVLALEQSPITTQF